MQRPWIFDLSRPKVKGQKGFDHQTFVGVVGGGMPKIPKYSIHPNFLPKVESRNTFDRVLRRREGRMLNVGARILRLELCMLRFKSSIHPNFCPQA